MPIASSSRMCALVLAHHSPELVGRLLSRLEQFGIASFVHVDRKADIVPFEANCQSSTTSFLADRVKLHWGGFSIVQATLNLIEAALCQGDYSHFLLISGDTYPVRGHAKFCEYLLSGVNHIEIREVAPRDAVYQRIAHVYLPDTDIGALIQRSGDPTVSRYITAEVISQFPDIQSAFALKSQSFPWRFAKGSQFWCLTRSAVEQCLKVAREEPEFVSWFRYSSAPDESFFHSVFLNFLDEPKTIVSPVFTIWDRTPRPFVFSTTQDLELLDRCRSVLARKFTGQSISVLEHLDATLDSPRGLE